MNRLGTRVARVLRSLSPDSLANMVANVVPQQGIRRIGSGWLYIPSPCKIIIIVLDIAIHTLSVVCFHVNCGKKLNTWTSSAA